MFSLYTSVYNLNSMGFNWRATLDNWMAFLSWHDELVIAVNTSTDDTYEAVRSHLGKWDRSTDVKWSVIKTDVPYSNPRFDGLIKDAALKVCTGDFAILLDIDEVFVPGSRSNWVDAANRLSMDSDAMLIPTIDLFHSPAHMMGMGYKFYLHRNNPNIGRGVVGYADKADGSIDITKSDTTEVIYRNNCQLVRSQYSLPPNLGVGVKLNYLANSISPYVWHLGWLDKQQRLRQSAFWAPVWNARAGAEVEKPKTIDDLNNIKYWEHGLVPPKL